MVNSVCEKQGCSNKDTGILRWAVNTNRWQPTRTEWLTAMRMVDNDHERNRINRYIYKKDAKHALVGRLLIRKCCEHFVGSKRFCLYSSNNSESSFVDNEDQLILERSDKGKPILIEIDSNGNHIPYQDFQFNISHSGDYCVLAADSSTTKLGIDVMKVEYSGGMHKLNDFFNIMRKQFSEDEWKYIRQSSSDYGRLARFIRLWSLKESFVKAEGSGIIFPLSKISFVCPSDLVMPSQKSRFDSIVNVLNGNYNSQQTLSNWIFEESMIDPKHYVSVAKLSQNSNAEELKTDRDYQFRMLSIKDLIPDFQYSDLHSFEDESYWIDFCQKS